MNVSANASAPVRPSAGPAPTIPVIDFGPCLAGAPGARAEAAAALRHALEHVGFFLMVGHGVPPRLIAETFAEARRFHDQPMAAKMALRMNEHNNRQNLMRSLPAPGAMSPRAWPGDAARRSRSPRRTAPRASPGAW
jgi:isopenicillin N synthase-like dioxygenase